MNPIYAVHFLNTPNIGDRLCSPLRYLSVGRPVRFVDISEFDGQGDAVIGGGGLLFRDHGNLERLLVHKGPFKRIVWGVGTNVHGETAAWYPEYLKHADLVGLRDFGAGHSFQTVPCASCLHPEFDVERQEPVHDAVVYEHSDFPIPLDLPKMINVNEADHFWRVLDFLASGEVVISNSYHGLYWASLLKRKTMCWEPFSNRFHYLSSSFNFVTGPTHWREQLTQLLDAPDSSAKVRLELSLNYRFREQVESLLNQ